MAYFAKGFFKLQRPMLQWMLATVQFSSPSKRLRAFSQYSKASLYCPSSTKIAARLLQAVARKILPFLFRLFYIKLIVFRQLFFAYTGLLRFLFAIPRPFYIFERVSSSAKICFSLLSANYLAFRKYSFASINCFKLKQLFAMLRQA